MEKLLFIFSLITVAVNANVYTVNVTYVDLANEEYLEVVDDEQAASEGFVDLIDEGDNITIIRKIIVDSPLHDGVIRYKNGDEIIKSVTVTFCNTDTLSIGGTAMYILHNALGLEDQTCPIPATYVRYKPEFKQTEGEFGDIFDNIEEVNLEIELDGLISATLTISKKDGVIEPDDLSE